jgi:ketosteroid isomerase-like protein
MTTAPEAEHPNAAIIRQLYDRLGNGDLTGFLDLIADDAVFHVGGDSIVAGDYVGKDAIVNLGLKVFEETNGTHRTDLLDVLANDSHTSALHRWSAERRAPRDHHRDEQPHRLPPRRRQGRRTLGVHREPRHPRQVLVTLNRASHLGPSLPRHAHAPRVRALRQQEERQCQALN